MVARSLFTSLWTWSFVCIEGRANRLSSRSRNGTVAGYIPNVARAAPLLEDRFPAFASLTSLQLSQIGEESLAFLRSGMPVEVHTVRRCYRGYCSGRRIRLY